MGAKEITHGYGSVLILHCGQCSINFGGGYNMTAFSQTLFFFHYQRTSTMSKHVKWTSNAMHLKHNVDYFIAQSDGKALW